MDIINHADYFFLQIPLSIFILNLIITRHGKDFKSALLGYSLSFGLNGVIVDTIKLLVGRPRYVPIISKLIIMLTFDIQFTIMLLYRIVRRTSKSPSLEQMSNPENCSTFLLNEKYFQLSSPIR